MIRIDVSPRQGGKTARLVEWLMADPENRRILVHSEKERQRLVENYGLTSDQVVTYQRHPQQGQEKREVAIDNLDLFFYETLGQIPEEITSTDDVAVVRHKVR